MGGGVTARGQNKIETNCSTDVLHLNLLKYDKKYENEFAKNTDLWRLYPEKEKNKILKRGTSATTLQTLNVAFHDILGGSPSQGTPLTIAQLDNALTVVNDFFNGSSNGSNGSGSDAMIQFCRATRNNRGDAFQLTYNNIAGATLNSGNLGQMSTLVNLQSTFGTMILSDFPSDKFVNIYIVDDIPSTTAGFATLPSTQNSTNPSIDGIYIERAMLNGSNDNTKVLVHELGHYLGLFHIFGICDPFTTTNPTAATCSCDNGNPLFNGDMIPDTPPSELTANSCDLTLNTCLEATGAAAVFDDKTNYMDYSEQSCQNHFTNGQITRMQFMIDPIDGVRKGLLGNTNCVNCADLNVCNFTINATPSLGSTLSSSGFGTLNTIKKTSASFTPVILFSSASSCSSAVTYNWSLISLDNIITLINATGANYSTPNNLAAGNYKLQLMASSISNTNCFETVTYAFTILPHDAVCNVINPNNVGGWENFTRISFSNGWTRQINTPYNYVNGSVPHLSNTSDPLFAEDGFSIIPLLPGGTLSDVNFSTVTLPANAGITSVFRVGKTSENISNSAYFAKINVPVNQNNCKYRIWYLGRSEGSGTSFGVFPFTSTQKSASFGFKTLLNYNSGVNTETQVNNSAWGQDENGFYVSFVPTYTRRVNYKKNVYNLTKDSGGNSNIWLYRDIDLSQFVNLASEANATFTFFAHTNETQGLSFQNAYGYFAIECLGGGIPELISFNVPDHSMPCSSPNSFNKVQISLPKAPYFNNDEQPFNLDQNLLNFADVDLFKKNVLTGNWELTTAGISANTNSSEGFVEFSVTAADVPFATYKLVYKTLHQTITNEFRVFVGFYNNLPQCTTGDKIDAIAYPENYYLPIFNQNNRLNIFMCTSQTQYPELILTNSCITQPHTFEWYKNDILLLGETQPNLQLTATNFFKGSCQNNTFQRKTIYKEPYCGNKKEKLSDTFNIYSNQVALSGYDAGFISEDVCFGDNYSLEITNLRFNSCAPPAGFGFDTISNSLTLELYFVNGQHIVGNSHTINFNGAFTQNSYANNLVFNFNTAGLDSILGPNLFVPQQLGMHIFGNYLGCPVDIWQGNITALNFRTSAVGGIIGYNCSTHAITSLNGGNSSGNLYSWEFALNNGNFNPLVAITTATLTSLQVNNLLAANPNQILRLRRISFGFPQCSANAISNTIVIQPNPPTSIIFNNLPTILCSNTSNFTLPTSATNGIEGIWTPASIPVQIGTHTLTFAANAGYCLANPTFTYVVTITNNIQPIFNPVASVCAGSYVTLPATSINGISGSWSPNLATTLLNSDTTFTFTPNTGVCSTTTVQITVTVLPTNNITFDFPTVLCNTAAAPLLPTQSLEGVTGTWLPNIIDTVASGGYVFTPNGGQCASATTINVTVNSCGFDMVSTVADVGCQSADFNRKYYESSVVDGDCMKICEGLTITYYIFGPNNNNTISSLDWIVSGGTIMSTTSNSCTIQWVNASFASFLVKINLIGGSIFEITRCIEKVNGPTALFSINTEETASNYETCTNLPVNFSNLSTSSNGNDVLYYNWNFGDGTFSNLFEPSHIYTAQGAYQVVLTVSNGCNCTSQYIANVTVKRNNLVIDCPGVVCEGDTKTYSIKNLENCNTINWTVEGGTITNPTSSNEVSVLWNQVGENGFGYLYASSPDCLKCLLPLKIPVVQQTGSIVGNSTMCLKSQGTYKLPQWPSTVYNWTLENNTTGAELISNDTGNEVIVNSGASGEITLKCTYYNTLLNCGGSAKFPINVTYIAFAGDIVACTGTTYHYDVVDDHETLLPATDWFVTGPNNFLVYGNSGSFDLIFPLAGTYYITQGLPSSAGQDPSNSISCSNATKIEVSTSQAPTTIAGPTVICPGLPITYSCTSQSGAIPIWTVTGGAIQGTNNGTTAVIIFNPLATTFSVSVAYQSGSCISQPYTVAISRDIPQFAITTPNTNVCGSSTETYTTAYANAETYAWSIEPSTAGSIAQGQNSNQVSVLWNQPTGATSQATVKLQIRVCGSVYTQNKPVTIINHPTLQITGAGAACNNQPTSFNFTMSAGATFTTATWNFGDNTPPEVVTFGSVSNPFTVNHTYASNVLATSTTFPVTLTVTGGNNCAGIGTSNYSIVVSPTPIITLNLPTNSNICNNENSQATAFVASVNIQAGFAYTNTIQWYRNNSPIPAGNTATINVSNVANGFGAGTYYAIVTNSLGCSQNTANFIVTNDCGTTGGGPEGPGGTICNCTLQGQALITGCGKVSAQITVAGCTPVSTVWSSGIAGATITSNTIYNYQLDNIPFGSHNITAQVTFINALGETCTKNLNMPFIRPYKADLRYTATCNASNNGYAVTLLDHSVHHPNYPITNHSFTIDDGNSWYTATLVNNIHQYNLPFLPPGLYNVGIKINDGLNGDCTKFITLNLPAAPSSAFTFDNNQCSTEPVHFYATNNVAGLQYRWILQQPGVINLQPNPVLFTVLQV